MFRSVVGLEYAAACLRPKTIPSSRPKGVRAAGLRYERALAKAIPRATHGQWFEFSDANGPGVCQTDLLLLGAKRAIVIEAKLSRIEDGIAQLRNLYLPVVGLAFPEKKAIGIVAARHLSKETNLSRVVDSLEEAILVAEGGEIPTLHWLERTPL